MNCTNKQTHEAPEQVENPFGPLDIVYADADLVVIEKPAGLLVHRSYLARRERWFAMQMLRDQLGQHVFPVHRLDRPTSGLLLFALSAEVAAAIQNQFQAGQIRRSYHAVVRGYAPEQGRIDYPLKEELDKIADKQANQEKPAQTAITNFERLACVELPFQVSKKYPTTRYSLLKLQPETGRKHQLRRHLAHLRHPIVGDTRHGDGRHNVFFREHFQCHRLLLAATELRFIHPVTKKPVHLERAIPESFTRVFD
ncbi:tRNA pseudouridine(65) synthase TruC [Aliidiomarina taiwanensis]|uniref:tRNA pseudouridine synthase C n=1 Tax=Aliidiomarina taiwanensis TaxID=946228 RepID=A0A432XAK7_9GAMM|nr:tRNA pseudouridine(65) synthase TruC [Aliidiomarina taiwanensis]RUO44364.1 tRNA pseudouridine(65) synthase TruC [Aliidiomarina taiwanensis]